MIVFSDEIELPKYDNWAYELASRVMRQGVLCDNLARVIRKKLPDFLEDCRQEAMADLTQSGNIFKPRPPR